MIEYHFRREVDLPNANYLTHGLHPYPARFIPHIPHWFLRKYGRPGAVMLDPFAGSGTALVEAALLGMDALGVDLNPLSGLLIRTKTTIPPNLRKFAAQVRKGMAGTRHTTVHFEPPLGNLSKWFQPEAIESLGRIFGYLQQNPDGLATEAIEFLQICASGAVRAVCNADPQVSKPFVSRRRRAALAAGTVPDDAQAVFERRVRAALARKKAYVKAIEQRAAVFGWARYPTVDYLAGVDARTLAGVADDSVDVVVTSPPYANAQEYLRSVKFELLWLGLVDVKGLRALDATVMGSERLPQSAYQTRPTSDLTALDAVLGEIYAVDAKRAVVVQRYFEDMAAALGQMARVLKPGGVAGLLVGDNVIRKVPVPTHMLVAALAERAGLTVTEMGYDAIHVRALGPQRAAGAGWIDGEWLLTVRKG